MKGELDEAPDNPTSSLATVAYPTSPAAAMADNFQPPGPELLTLSQALIVWNQLCEKHWDGDNRDWANTMTENQRIDVFEEMDETFNAPHWSVLEALGFLQAARPYSWVSRNGVAVRPSDFLRRFRDGFWHPDPDMWADVLWHYCGQDIYMLAHLYRNTQFTECPPHGDESIDVQLIVGKLGQLLDWDQHIIDCLTIAYLGNVRNKNVTDMCAAVLRVTARCNAVETGRVVRSIFMYRAKPSSCRCKAACACAYALEWDPDYEKANKYFEHICREKEWTQPQQREFLAAATRGVFSHPRLSDLCDYLELGLMPYDCEVRQLTGLELQAQIFWCQQPEMERVMAWDKGCVFHGCRKLPKTGCDNAMCMACCRRAGALCLLAEHRG